MNKITKRSFYSFLTLYLVSSFFFLSLASYWFYSAQVSMEMNNNYYKMSNVADKVSADVIYAHMMDEKFELKLQLEGSIALYDENEKLLYGSKLQDFDFTQKYYMDGRTFTLISQATAGHLNVKYVVVQSNECSTNIMKLQNSIVFTGIIVALIIIVIAVLLSYMFLKPIRDKMHEIENFVKDTTHELNTPITALMMSTSRAKSKQVYDEKIMNNISISTKQLYEIYSTLSFLSFDNSKEQDIELNFDEVVQASLSYFNELIEKKSLNIELSRKKCTLFISPTKARMLVNNLLSNSIKYSHPNTTIKIHIDENSFSVKDEGIGIAKDKLQNIFDRFTRANSYAGGFGVGLNIVKSITNEYDIELSIESEENRGTEVILKF